MSEKLTPVGKPAEVLRGKVAIRFRKTTASWAIYNSGKVVASGFADRESAEEYLSDWYDVQTETT